MLDEPDEPGGDAAAYTRAEWNAYARPDWGYCAEHDRWEFQGQPFSGKVERLT